MRLGDVTERRLDSEQNQDKSWAVGRTWDSDLLKYGKRALDSLVLASHISLTHRETRVKGQSLHPSNGPHSTLRTGPLT